jgi:hypothetical protein
MLAAFAVLAANYKPSTSGSPHKTLVNVEMKKEIIAKRTA